MEQEKSQEDLLEMLDDKMWKWMLKQDTDYWPENVDIAKDDKRWANYWYKIVGQGHQGAEGDQALLLPPKESLGHRPWTWTSVLLRWECPCLPSGIRHPKGQVVPHHHSLAEISPHDRPLVAPLMGFLKAGLKVVDASTEAHQDKNGENEVERHKPIQEVRHGASAGGTTLCLVRSSEAMNLGLSRTDW